ncbi:RNA-directed DNA polymerase (Reverse transcriptase), partial [Trifolium medium]|nr:RNA-directed DNA polymerase (Reverse transcriptase) [Trifolium medium]
MNTIGVHYTWANGREGTEYVALRLDRVICNQAWLLHWNSIHCCTLFKHCSDHHPLLVTQAISNVQHALPFRFFNVWTTHVDCVRVVRELWSKPVYGAPMYCLQQKLKRLKLVLKKWNKDVFGNVDINVKLAVDDVIRIQNLIDANGITADLQRCDYQAQLVLTKALLSQDGFWKEKARIKHFLHGDRNTSYFHRVAKIKSATNQIHLLNGEEGMLTDSVALENHIVSTCTSNNLVQECIPDL